MRQVEHPRQPDGRPLVIRRIAAEGEGKDTKQITVPAYIARQIPLGTLFRCELVEEGILFRREVPAEKPSWVKEGLLGRTKPDQ